IQPLLHLVGGIRRVGHAGLEIVEEVAHQEETVVRFAFDDLVRSPEFVVNVGKDQPAHSVRPCRSPLSLMTPAIGSLPCTLEVFYPHAGPSASVVHALATLREDYFDAVGPERRLPPFGPIRIRTVICKGDGFFDRLSFNGSGQFSYLVRDDREYHFRLLLYRVLGSLE